MGDNKIMYIGPNDSLTNYFMDHINPNLQLIFYEDNTRLTGFGSLFLFKSPILNFLRNSDFGLVDPNQPPSFDNPPLSTYLIKIIQSNAINCALLNIIFCIYVVYHQISRD